MKRAVLLVAACTVGPDYHRPRAPMPAADAYKEWKLAAPADAIPRGRWWTMFREPELDGLEARLNIDNQNIIGAIDNYVAAVAQIRAARATYFPTVTVAPGVTTSRGGFATGAGNTNTGTTGQTVGRPGAARVTSYSLPLEASWVPDLFGRVRRTVAQRKYQAQALAADVENTRLLEQATLAQTFFELRGQDAQIDLLADTVKADESIVDLTAKSYQLGITSEADVLQAQLTLQTARVQLTNAGLARAQFEHAIASLLGVPATSFSLEHRALHPMPPAVPTGTPSQLLERRPDIAAAERSMAAANEAIGIGYAAYFPVLTLTGQAGFAAQALDKLLTWPSRVWALGANLSETIFDGGLRRANIDLAYAQYMASIATYRQTVLTAFQQVEDQLAALRIVADALDQQRTAVAMAERSYAVEKARYASGLDPYITLMTQQIALLSAHETLLSLEIQQMTASVILIQALGGGWDARELPSP
jgi:NodT family efflux transporter outer membrane factor (OMF) lipoprotein